MNSFRFANPAWLHAAWGVLALGILLVALELRGRTILNRFLSPVMQGRLVQRLSLPRRLSAVGLFCLAMLCLVVAVMRPQWGMSSQVVSKVDSQIMICLDVSKSMLAEDVVPNRLDRAKAEIDSLLSLMDDGQQVGLIAFAGKASVLCPMTTDFGFLRLVLAGTDTESVGLGGTRIGEALRMAVDGFRHAGDVNRLILLVTDGEDHDSLPMDAAALAKEKGVHIVSIGFGDEAGSKIEITDPDSGARRFVTDFQGQPVISRLDGETLRSLALETDGAYIPAGTGALDLESIYRSHIAGLLSGVTAQEERVIRNEAYQWCVLLGLLLWLLSLLCGSAFKLARSPSEAARRLGVPGMPSSRIAGGLLLGCMLSLPCLGQLPSAEPSMADDNAAVMEPPADGSSADDDLPATPLVESADSQRRPREVYNDAVGLVRRDPDRAKDLLHQARSLSGADGELRFRAIYNLGWVEVTRAEAMLESQPEEALKHLQVALTRFREAVRVRPESREARHNLEIISRRILQLTDSLAQRDPADFAKRLDELLAAQRAHQFELQRAVAQSTAAADVDQLRGDFRQLAVRQRELISDLERLTTDARNQVDAAQQSEPTQPQERLQIAQLAAMLEYVERGLNWMNKSRSFTRRLEAQRAFLRWSAALDETRQARDQLRDPVEILGSISADALELVESTDRKATPSADPADGSPAAPDWLTQEYLDQTQRSIIQRTAALHELLAEAVETSKADAAPASSDPGQAALVNSIDQALPWLDQAREYFTTAEARIADADFIRALQSQLEAVEALQAAAELFLDLRRLIEVTYADERLLQARLAALDAQNPPDIEPLESMLRELQANNLKRAERLRLLIEQQLQALAESAESVASAEPGESPTVPRAATQDQQVAAGDAERERLHLAQSLLPEVTEHMQQVAKQLEDLPATLAEPTADQPPDDDASPEATPGFPTHHVDAAVQRLEDLRRLFFTLVEHLKETANRQAKLNDETATELGRHTDASRPQLGPYQARQRALHDTTERLADALAQQSAAASEPGEAPAADAERAAEAAQQLESAAELVRDGAGAMQSAIDAMPAAPQEVAAETLSASQRQALAKLVEALELLDQPQQPSGDQAPPQNSGGDQNQQQPSADDQPTQTPDMNAAQMLQAIREREAERHRQQNRAATAGNAAVEKDW